MASGVQPPKKIAPAWVICALRALGSATHSSKCSGAIRSLNATASRRLDTVMIAPKSRQLAAAISRRSSVLSWFSTATATATANSGSSVINIDCAFASCSAWLNKSKAIQLGSFSASAITNISEGPAIISMPTFPNTRRFAAAT